MVDRVEQRFVAAGLLGEVERLGGLVFPGFAMGILMGAETGFGEEDGFVELFLDGFDFCY